MNHTSIVEESLDAVSKVLLRCFIIGFLVLIICFIVVLFSAPFAHGVFSTIYPISKEAFDLMRLCALLLVKIELFVFFLLPYIAIRMTLNKLNSEES